LKPLPEGEIEFDGRLTRPIIPGKRSVGLNDIKAKTVANVVSRISRVSEDDDDDEDDEASEDDISKMLKLLLESQDNTSEEATEDENEVNDDIIDEEELEKEEAENDWDDDKWGDNVSEPQPNPLHLSSQPSVLTPPLPAPLSLAPFARTGRNRHPKAPSLPPNLGPSRTRARPP
jgi:hypothetical protein